MPLTGSDFLGDSAGRLGTRELETRTSGELVTAYGLARALQEDPADSLWVVWAGNSISDPVVF